jgi:hypothetical protein
MNIFVSVFFFLLFCLVREGACWDLIVNDVSLDSTLQTANTEVKRKPGQITKIECDKEWGAWCHDFTLWQVKSKKQGKKVAPPPCKTGLKALRAELTALGMTQHVYPSVLDVRKQQSEWQKKHTTYYDTCMAHVKEIESFFYPWDVIIMAGHSGVVDNNFNDLKLKHVFNNSNKPLSNKLTELVCQQKTKDTKSRTPRSKKEIEIWRWLAK